MGWIEKLPQWAIGVSLGAIAIAFAYVLIAQPSEFSFMGLKFGTIQANGQAVGQTNEHLSDEISVIREDLSRWDSEPAVVGNQSGGGDQKVPTMCPDGHYASGINWWGSPGSTRYCIGCLSGIQVVCRRLNVGD